MTAFARGGGRRRGEGGRLAGEIRLSGTAGSTTSRVLAGISRVISRSVTGSIQPPFVEILCRWSRGQVGLSLARVPRGCSGAGLSERLEKKDQKGMAETVAGMKGRGEEDGDEGGGTRLFTLGKRGIMNPWRLRDPRRTQSIDSDVGGIVSQPRLTGITLGKGRRTNLSPPFSPILSSLLLPAIFFASYPFFHCLFSHASRRRIRSLSRSNCPFMIAAVLRELVSCV